MHILLLCPMAANSLADLLVHERESRRVEDEDVAVDHDTGATIVVGS